VGDLEGEFLAFVAERRDALRRTAYLLCRDVHQADDLVQTALTKVYLSWRKVRRADNREAYVHTVLLRVFLDERRRGWWKVELSEQALENDRPPEDTDARIMMRRALDELAPRQRAALVLRFYLDLSVEQTAQLLDCSPGTVKSQTSRALVALEKVLARQGHPAALAGARG